MKVTQLAAQTGCRHTATSLVEMDTKENGPFLTIQCDICGQCLPDAPIDDTTFGAWFERRTAVPRMDYPAYCGAVERAWRDVLAGDVTGLEVFAKVARGN